MKKICLGILLVCNTLVLQSQTLFDTEVKSIVERLIEKVNLQMKGRNIAVTDFVDSEDQPSELGRYLTEEFSYALVNAATDFRVVDRSQLRKLLEEAGIGDKGMVDPESVQKLGRLQGISAVVYGKIMPLGNQVRVFTKVVVLEELVNVITERGDITRTPTIEGLLNKSAPDSYKASSTPAQPTAAPFSHKNIQVVLTGCRDAGAGTVQCELSFTSAGRSDNLALETADSYLLDNNGRRYRALKISAAGQAPSSVQAHCALPQGQPVGVSVLFAAPPPEIRNLEGLYLKCKSYAAFGFTTVLKNIDIR